MRILIRGVGVVNKGAEALLRTIRTEVARRVPEATFFVEPSNFRRESRSGLALLGVQRPGGVGARMSARVSTALLTYRVQRLFGEDAVDPRLTDNIDLVLDASGFAFGDDWSPRKASVTSRLIDRLHAGGGRYAFLPQAWGPFHKHASQVANRAMLRKADLFVARDGQSQSHLSELTGTAREQIRVCPDVAFRFSDHERFADQTIAGVSPRSSVPLVGVNPSRKVYARLLAHDREAADGYLNLFRSACEHLERRGCRVLYLPHEIKQQARSALDDRLVCDMVSGRPAVSASHESGVRRGRGGDRFAAFDVTDAPRLKALLARCQFLVGSRYHSLVAALSSQRPVIAVGWSHKYQELLRPFGLQAYSHHVAAFETPRQWSIVEQAVREQIDRWLDGPPAEFTATLREHRRDVDQLFDELAQMSPVHRPALAG